MREVMRAAVGRWRRGGRLLRVQVRENMLWVWGESGAEAFIHSAATTPAVTAELEALPADTRVYRIGKPYSRDLHYSFETLVENFLVRWSLP